MLWVQEIPGLVYNGDGRWKVDGGCGRIATLPNMTFVIGGAAFSVPPAQWVQTVRALLIDLYLHTVHQSYLQSRYPPCVCVWLWDLLLLTAANET